LSLVQFSNVLSCEGTRSHSAEESAWNLSIVKVEASARLSRGGVGVHSNNKGQVASDEGSRGGLALHTKDQPTHVGLEGLHSQGNRNVTNSVHTEAGDGGKS